MAFFKSNNAKSSGARSNGAPAVDKDYQTINSANAPKVLKEFRERLSKGLPVHLDTGTLAAIVDALRHKDSIDDRKLLLEHALAFVSKLPDGPFALSLRNTIIQLLYNDLAHPPATQVSSQYAWRTADGSYNNIDVPNLGKAGTAYSRSVQQSHPLPRNQLPDPGLVFDTLLRREKFVKHPAGLSSLMFAFAALVIHSVFRTSHRDPNINETSSYVDLAPLYGNSQKDQDLVRNKNGRGMLHPDAFAEDRLLLLPPAVCTLLVLFNRNHNYIAAKLLKINERGKYVDPETLSPDNPAENVKLLAQEEDIFQTARLINCGWFGMVVFSDYFSSILGLVRDGSSWSLTPFDEMRMPDHTLFERGKGNQCSVEFNCLYRWHATTSVQDEQWTQKIFSQLFPGKPTDEITVNDFKSAAAKVQQSQPDLTHWTFGGIGRDSDGSFKDDDLAKILHDATEHPAACFGARSTPSVFKLNEVMGIEQNRTWGVCSLNDFRKFLGLKPYATFLEWNSNPEIADAAEKLYGNIDYLELYTGLQAEEAKPVVDGAGLCPGYTISRAILSDAIALTRGDRYFTHDFTPYNLTAWGFADCQRDPNAFGFGSMLGRLLLRTLPNNFTENSVYTFFPLMTPDSMKVNLKKLGLLDQYDLSRPGTKTPLITVDGYNRVAQILQDKNFQPPFKARLTRVLGNIRGFFPAQDAKDQLAIISTLAAPDLTQGIEKYFYESTKKLIAANSFTLVGGKVGGIDIVRQVFRILPVHWAATDLARIQLKTTGHPHGAYTPVELGDILRDIYSFVFLNVEAARVMVLQAKVKTDIEKLLHLIKSGLARNVGSRASFAAIIGSISNLFESSKQAEYHDIVKRLYELGHSTDQLANTILALMVVSTTELTLAMTNVAHFYLDGRHASQTSQLSALVSKDKKASLDSYVYEALRLSPTLEGVFRVSQVDQTVAGQPFKKDELVFLSTASANVDDAVFPDSLAFDLTRPIKDCLFADGAFRYLGEGLSVKIVSQVIRAIFELDNLRTAPGVSGTLSKFKNTDRPELCHSYLSQVQLPSELPATFTIMFDLAK